MSSVAQRRSTLHYGLKSTRAPEINRCSPCAVEKEEEEEQKHTKKLDLYIRINKSMSGYNWFVIKNSMAAMSRNKSPICVCGAVANLTDPCFPLETYRPNSNTVAVGDKIYVFGGLDVSNECVDSLEVSSIDTLCPNKGWKVCQRQIPGLRKPYLVILKKNDIESVLLVGGYNLSRKDHPYAQMYYPLQDKWVVIESEPDQRPCSVFGHAVVERGGETIVVMHDYRSPKLFTYNVDTGSWGILWDGEFGQYYHTGALVGRIYYVLDVFCRDSVSLCGYDLQSEKATCLPVTILLADAEKKKKKNNKKKNKNKNKVEKEWVPFSSDVYSLPWAKLFSVGDTKMAMVWQSSCFSETTSLDCCSVHWSTFEMERTDDGKELKLFARPLYHVCYHVNNYGKPFDCFVPVFPSDTAQTKSLAALQASPPTRGGKGKETRCQD